MQNRYTGDIGDFGKYGLLRILFMPEFGGLNLRLGVNWYLVPNESHNNDGRHITYLQDNVRNHEKFKTCDHILYEKLQGIVWENRRTVDRVEDRGIFPQDTLFYRRKLSYENIHLQNRLASRQAWARNGLDTLQDCEVVFFDPDNGIEVKSYSPISKKGPKYVYYKELEPYYIRGQSLIIYNHKSRQQEEEYLERYRGLRDILQPGVNIFYLRFKCFSSRDFVFVLQPDHQGIRERAKEILKTSWSKHFEYCDLS